MKGNKKPNTSDVIVADFETTTSKNFKNRSLVYLANWMWLDDVKEEDHFSYTIAEFFNQLCDLEKPHITLYFHNGGKFDFHFILWFVISALGYNHCYSKNDVIKGNRIWTIEDTHKIYEMSFRIGRTIFDLKDSILLLQSSIKDLGKDYGLNKLDYDYDTTYNENNEYTQKDYDYIHNDVAIMRRALWQFNEFWPKGIKKLTIASTTYEEIRNIVRGDDFKLTLEQFLYFKRFYRGGFTSYSPLKANKWLKGDWNVYDINSSYPFAQTLPQPYGQPLDEPPTDTTYYYTLCEIMIYRADIRDKNWIPCLPRQKFIYGDNETEYVWHTTNQKIYITDFEFEVLKKFYDIDYKIIKKTYFRCKDYLSPYILRLYDLKLKYKSNGDKARFGLVKIGINSLYGKFAQNPIREQVYYLTEEQAKSKEFEKLTKTKIRNKDSWIGDKVAYVMTEEDPTKLDIKYIPIAVIITSIARTKLLKAIWENRDNVVYCDTDSIFCNGIAKGIEIDETKLGAWKIEGTGKELKIIQAKFYRMYDENGIITKSASAGVKKEIANKIPKDKYKKGMEIHNGKLSAVKVEGGIIIQEKTTIIGKQKIIYNLSGTGNATITNGTL